jgi:hypothetical protein
VSTQGQFELELCLPAIFFENFIFAAYNKEKWCLLLLELLLSCVMQNSEVSSAV